MENNNRRAGAPDGVPPPTAAGSKGAMDTGYWRGQLQADSRQQIVNKIMETLKRHLPFSGQEGLQELKKIAIRFEERVYTVATSQSDYLQKISLSMLTMESKLQNTIPNGSKPPDSRDFNGHELDELTRMMEFNLNDEEEGPCPLSSTSVHLEN